MLYDRTLLDSVPKYYSELLESKEILHVEDIELKVLYENIYEILLQTRISTATWGLDYWEKFVGINTDYSKSYDARRGGVRAAIRGYGTITAEHIKSISESYIGGEINVIQDFANYRIVIEFVDILGIPEHVEDLKEKLATLIPAHLELSFKFKYNVYENYSSIPYFKLNQFTYKEILEEEVEYSGSTNTQLSTTINSTLSAHVNKDLLGGFTDV